MELNVRTIITNTSSTRQVGGECLFVNEMVGKSGDSYFDLNWSGDAVYRMTDKTQLPISVLDKIPIDKSKCNFVHIYAFNSKDGVEQISHPVRFLLRVNGIVLGYMSQFELGNISQLTYDIIIEDIELDADDQVDLAVVVGAKV